jgi:pimeloyl-ACP methyl ester carboxylesterase
MFPPGADPALVERVANDMASAPPEVAIPAIESSFGYSRRVGGVLDEIRRPGIAINPDNEPTDTASLKRHGFDVLVVPGVGHFLMMEDPPRFNRMLEVAIERLTKR